MILRILSLSLLTILSSFAVAEVDVSDVRVKAPVPGQSISGGYLLINNDGNQDVTLVSVTSDSASRVEMHTHTMQDGMMGMKEMDSVIIESGKSVSFIEGGHHLMIFDPDSSAIESGEFNLTFEFSDGTSLDETAAVEHFVKSEHKHH